MKKIIFFITVFALLLMTLGVSVVQADEEDTGYPWFNHAGKYDVEFNNLIDNHQQMRLLKNGWLQGYIYIQFTGEFIDSKPVARRVDCTNPALYCRVGWEVIGIPVSGAKLVQKGPRIWDIDAANLPDDPEFTHFHWIEGTDGKNPQKPCGLKLADTGVTYSGYLFKRVAVTEFYWLGGNEDKETGRLVIPGIDLHSNLLGRWTSGGGNHDGGHDGEEPGGDDAGGCGGHDGEEPGDDNTGGCTDDTVGCGGH